MNGKSVFLLSKWETVTRGRAPQFGLLQYVHEWCMTWRHDPWECSCEVVQQVPKLSFSDSEYNMLQRTRTGSHGFTAYQLDLSEVTRGTQVSGSTPVLRSNFDLWSVISALHCAGMTAVHTNVGHVSVGITDLISDQCPTRSTCVSCALLLASLNDRWWTSPGQDHGTK